MRTAAASHLERFQQAFVQWRFSRNRSARSGIDAAVALERWLGEWPEHAETIQRFALGGCINAVLLEEWHAGRRLAAAGLNASLLGALSTEERLANTVLLGFLGARSELGLGDARAARTRMEPALETLQRMNANSALETYLQLQRHVISAELAESSLEISEAASSFAHALELLRSITASQRREREIEGAWVVLAFGKVPDGQDDASRELWVQELQTARRRATLGLGRTSADAEAARAALRWCAQEGLPLADTPLALIGLLSKIPADEIDATADALVAVAESLEAPHRNTWVTSIRAMQAGAWFGRADLHATARAIDSIDSEDLRGADAIAVGLAFAARARLTLTTDDSRDAVDLLLSIHGATTRQMSGTSYELRFRAAMQPAIETALIAELEQVEHTPSIDLRHLSLLLDALRAPEASPALVRAQDSIAQQAASHASNRLGRIAAALANRGKDRDTLVLIIQGAGDATTFVCIGGDAKHPFIITPPDDSAHRALRGFSAAVEQALEDDEEVDWAQAGREAFDALPAVVRERILHSRNIVVIPDAAQGQDRVPIELLHDGAGFLGMRKVIARCISLSHALSVLEAPLVSRPVGRHALCVSVAAPPGLPALQFASEEIDLVTRALRGAMWRATAVKEGAANAQTILEVAPLANVVHIACHGEASAGAEALVLADGVRLSAAEIATRHRLRGLIYLNACSLAQGRYLGGGVSRGVAYAFVKAGAPCVIANLLPVEDEGAARLSDAFYDAACEQPIGEAMRLAREELSSTSDLGLLASTVVIGDPFRMLGGDSKPRMDSTSKLFNGEVAPKEIPARRGPGNGAGDPRFAAAKDFARALRENEPEFETLAYVARDIGHEIGEAHCWLKLAERARESADPAALNTALRNAIATLEPLRGVWAPALEFHREARDELRSLDPGYEPRTVKSFHTAAGLSVNDRSDPAVDATLRIFEALQEHETHWRGEPVLLAIDNDDAAIAHNAVLWGYLNRVDNTGAEAGVAAACAARAASRGLIDDGAIVHLGRILAGLLKFLWGKQKVTHLEHWMAGAHRDVIAIAIDRVRRYWTPPEQSPALGVIREFTEVMNRLSPVPRAGSKFAQARAALLDAESAAPDLNAIKAQVETTIKRLYASDPYMAADYGAWVMGDLLHRATGAGQPDVALSCTSLYEAFELDQDGWYMAYLMDGFKEARETGGQDVFAQWSSEML